MKYLLFGGRFVRPIRELVKLHTIRDDTDLVVGERFALKAWSGTAYRSPQYPICEPQAVQRLSLVEWKLVGPRPFLRVAGSKVPGRELDRWAVSDGFASWEHFVGYHVVRRNERYSGVMIEWGRDLPGQGTFRFDAG